FDRGAQRAIVAVHQATDGFRVEAFVQRCRPDQVGEDDRDDLAGRGRSVGAKWWRWAGLDDERAATSAAEPEARRVLGAAARASRHEAVPAAPAELHVGRVVEAAGSAGHGRYARWEHSSSKQASARSASPTAKSSQRWM